MPKINFFKIRNIIDKTSYFGHPIKHTEISLQSISSLTSTQQRDSERPSTSDILLSYLSQASCKMNKIKDKEDYNIAEEFNESEPHVSIDLAIRESEGICKLPLSSVTFQNIQNLKNFSNRPRCISAIEKGKISDKSDQKMKENFNFESSKKGKNNKSEFVKPIIMRDSQSIFDRIKITSIDSCKSIYNSLIKPIIFGRNFNGPLTNKQSLKCTSTFNSTKISKAYNQIDHLILNEFEGKGSSKNEYNQNKYTLNHKNTIDIHNNIEKESKVFSKVSYKDLASLKSPSNELRFLSSKLFK